MGPRSRVLQQLAVIPDRSAARRGESGQASGPMLRGWQSNVSNHVCFHPFSHATLLTLACQAPKLLFNHISNTSEADVSSCLPHLEVSSLLTHSLGPGPLEASPLSFSCSFLPNGVSHKRAACSE